MLRQIHIYYKGERIFNYSYARAFGDEELNNVQKTIQSYIDMPMPGKTHQRPASNYQLFHKTFNNALFLFITDLIDHLDYVEKIVEKTIKKCKELFPDLEKFKESEVRQAEFTRFLKGMQHELHSKIVIVGPTNSGKTLLYNMLREDGEKQIMNFAKSSNYNIDDLRFDLWDFQLNDNFSLLWSKFISGADLVILVFDLSNYHLRVINHFLNLKNQENKLSKLIIFGNKRDLVSDNDIKIIKNELSLTEFVEISLLDSNAKNQVNQIISNLLQLTKSLPSYFKDLINEAEDAVSDGNLVLALSKYKELINVCNTYQDLTYIQSFKKRVEEIQKKINNQNKLRRAEESKKKFELPGRIQFTKKIEVKALPTPQIKVPTKLKVKIPFEPEEKGKPKVPGKSTEDLTLFKTIDKKEESKKIYLHTDDIKIDLDVSIPHARRPSPQEPREESEFARELQILIKEKGSTLSLKLCEQLINELQKSLARPLTNEDIKMAADIFVKQESI